MGAAWSNPAWNVKPVTTVPVKAAKPVEVALSVKRPLPVKRIGSHKLNQIAHKAERAVKREDYDRKVQDTAAPAIVAAYKTGFKPTDTFILGSNAKNIVPETTEQLEARKAAYKAEGKNPNLLHRLSGSGYTQLANSRNDQRRTREYSDREMKEIPTKFTK